MKIILSVFFVFFVSFLVYPQSTIFEDDFESYTTGTHPAPWVTRFGGYSGTISEDVAVSGTKSFKLVAYQNWTRVEAYPIAPVPDKIIYEGYVYVNETTKGAFLGFGFKENFNTYRARNAFHFMNVGNLRFRSIVLQAYSAQTWYKVKAYCDFVQEVGHVWIDDVLVLENTPLSTRTEIVDFCILPNNFTASGLGTVYYDDIKIYMDTMPPEINVTVTPDMLWPPNHKMVAVNATVTVNDQYDPDPQVVLESITSNEPDDAKGGGDGNTVNDIQDADIGTEDYDFALRAERSGMGNGRIYTIIYSATDFSGNTAKDTAVVIVPHDKGMAKAVINTESVAEFKLLPNFPNPFNPETQINFQLPRESYVVIAIYDLLGREIRTLANDHFDAGLHSVVWDSRDSNGNFAPSGVYIYKIKAGEFKDVKKMVLLR